MIKIFRRTVYPLILAMVFVNLFQFTAFGANSKVSSEDTNNDFWSNKKDLTSVNETRSSTITYSGYSNITLTEFNNDVKKAVTSGNKIIYIHNDGKVMEYDPLNDTWCDKDKIPALQNSNGDFKLVTIDNLIYIIGVNFTDILVYDPTGKTCSLKTKLPTKRKVGGVASANNKIYIFGGFDSTKGSTIDTLEEYDPKTDRWTTKAHMLKPANSVAAAELNGEIYILGRLKMDFTDSGLEISQTLETYNIKNNIWNIKTTFNYGWNNETIEAANDKIYIIGNRNDDTVDSDTIQIEEYNPKTNKFIPRKGTSAQRSKYASAVLNGEIYIFGGVRYKTAPENPADSKKYYDELKANPISIIENVKTVEKYTPPKP